MSRRGQAPCRGRSLEGSLLHARVVPLAALLGVAVATAGPAPARAPKPLWPVGRDCSVTLRAVGLYRLTLHTAGPVPVVNFDKARGPIFDPIRSVGNLADCDREMGEITTAVGRSVTPLLFHVANELHATALVHWNASVQREQIEYAYRDFGYLADKVRREMLLMGFRQTIAGIASDLITRYANPAGYLTDKGARWVAETAVRMMIEAYVEGRDPGLIIDGLLTRMVAHLQGHAETLAGAVGGEPLKAALKPQLEKIAAAVTAELVEVQPDGQTVYVTAADDGNGCTHFLQINWNFKGGRYDAFLSIRCGKPPSDWIGRIAVSDTVVEPGEAGNVVARALSQIGVAMPLATASSAGIAAVQAAGAGEPNPVGLPGNAATFPFVVAVPKADRDYDVQVNLLTTDLVGRLVGLGRGRITVKNVAPTVADQNPREVESAPGEWLQLSPASIVILDQNADATNPGEVSVRTLRLAHPAGLRTTPEFRAPDNPRLVGHQAATGRYTFRFDRRGRIADPHEHGSWPLTVTMRDDDGETASTTIALTVRDVAPTVEVVRVTPGFVHREPGGMIAITVRVRDGNGAADIEGTQVDARAAGGAIYTVGGGLVESARGEDWIEYQTTSTFRSTREVGEHAIPVTVNDEANTGSARGTLHVGNVAPVIGGYGLLYDADSLVAADDPTTFVLTPPKGLCPGDHFRAGLIATDAEGDQLSVVARYRETGASTDLQHTSGNIWVADMTAPAMPGSYTIEFTVQEVPPDKSATVRMTIIVIECDQQRDETPRVAIGNPVTPPDIAAAPRDPTSQVMIGTIAGLTAEPAFAGTPGPGGSGGGPAEAIADTLAALLGEIEGNGRPPVEAYVLATGGSTGPVARLFAINRSDVPLRIAPQAVVLEPVQITPAIQSRVTDLLQRFVAAGGVPTTLDAYCLEFLRRPPAAGTLMRIAAADVAAPFDRFGGILGAAERIRDGMGLSPDSDPAEYFHAIRQWSIWTVAEGFDADEFAAEFVNTTRRNVEEGGGAWGDDLETRVRALVPNRWNDVQKVIREAGLTND